MLVRIGAFRRGRDRDEERHPRLERSKRRADPTELPLGAETASAADYDRSNVPEKLETQVDHLAAVLIDLNMPCGRADTNGPRASIADCSPKVASG